MNKDDQGKNLVNYVPLRAQSYPEACLHFLLPDFAGSCGIIFFEMASLYTMRQSCSLNQG